MLPLRKCSLLARNALSFVTCTSNYGTLCTSETSNPFRGMWAAHVRNNTLAYERGIFPNKVGSRNVRSIRSLSVSNIKYASDSETSPDEQKMPLYEYLSKNQSLLINHLKEDFSYMDILKEDKFLIRMLATQEMVKALMDTTNKSLSEKFNISLDVAGEDLPESVVSLKCNQSDLRECLDILCNKLSEFGSMSDKGEKITEIHLLFQNGYLSKFLSAKTTKDKKAKLENLGLKINEARMISDVLPFSTETVIILTALPSTIVDAVCKITELMRSTTIEGLQMLYDPKLVSGPLPKTVGGLCKGDEDALALDKMIKTKVIVPEDLAEYLDGHLRSIRRRAGGISIRRKAQKNKGIQTWTVHGYPAQHDCAFCVIREFIMNHESGPQYLETGNFSK